MPGASVRCTTQGAIDPVMLACPLDALLPPIPTDRRRSTRLMVSDGLTTRELGGLTTRDLALPFTHNNHWT
jgi:hypothetical protein